MWLTTTMLIILAACAVLAYFQGLGRRAWIAIVLVGAMLLALAYVYDAQPATTLWSMATASPVAPRV